jgi:uncharacterized membrane protein
MAIGPGYGMAASGRSDMRASDADRERAVNVLNAGFAEGRLPKDEYDERVGQVYSVPTRADLEQVTAQLPGGGPGLYGTPERRLNQLAVVSLACGAGQLILGPLATVPAVVLGHVARGQIRRTGEDGAGLALAGLLLGWAGLALTIIVVAVITIFFAALTHGSPPPPSP